jgi:hypothetical protein
MPRDITHETENQEQDDADTQAQTVADDALGRATDVYEDSEKGGSRDPAAIDPDDVPDLIDRMEQMVSSGHIDMDAYAANRRMTTRPIPMGPIQTKSTRRMRCPTIGRVSAGAENSPRT